MEKFLRAVGVGSHGSKDLSFEEAKEAMEYILEGKSDDIETGAFWMAMRYKGETPIELYGFLKALQNYTSFTDLSNYDPLDISVSYDGKTKTPHILPVSIFIAASCGLRLTGHGGENVPAKYGTNYYDVLIEMGCYYIKGKEDVVNAIELSNFTYLPQWCFNRKLFSLLPKRRKFHLRTYLNVIEKLINPFKAKKIITGIFHKPYFKKLKELFSLSGFNQYTVVKGLEGGIEADLFRETTLFEKDTETKLQPVKSGISLQKPLSLKENAKICYTILKGEEHTLRNWALQTAGLLLYAGKKVSSIEEGINIATESLLTGEALQVFETFKKISTESTKKIRLGL